MDLIEAKEELERRLIGRVVGVGANRDKGTIVVYVEKESDCSEIPDEFFGYNVECVPVGRVKIE